MGLAWNHPDNFSFPLKLLCVEAKRWKRLNSYIPTNQRYEYFFSYNRPGYLTRSRWQPNALIENWKGLHPPLEPDGPSVPGAQIRFSGGGQYLYLVLDSRSYPWTPTDELNELFPNPPGGALPQLTEVCSAIVAQSSQGLESPYPSSQFEGGFFRPEFLQAVLKRSKLVWEVTTPIEETEFNSFQRWVFLGAGRFQKFPDDRQADSQYPTGVFLQIPNVAARTIKLFEVSCNCCCCC